MYVVMAKGSRRKMPCKLSYKNMSNSSIPMISPQYRPLKLSYTTIPAKACMEKTEREANKLINDWISALNARIDRTKELKTFDRDTMVNLICGQYVPPRIKERYEEVDIERELDIILDSNIKLMEFIKNKCYVEECESQLTINRYRINHSLHTYNVATLQHCSICGVTLMDYGHSVVTGTDIMICPHCIHKLYHDILNDMKKNGHNFAEYMQNYQQAKFLENI